MANSMLTERGRTGRSTAEGTTGNERLTAWAGGLLFVLLAVEGVTILDLHALFRVHVFVGALLLGPLALKLASTGYRFVRYYGGSSTFQRKGPPHPVMRLLAPPLVLATVALFTSGIVLTQITPGDAGTWVFVHQASFVVWLALAAVHVIVYVWRVPHAISDDLRADGRPAGAGPVLRMTLAIGSLFAGAVAAAPLMPYAEAWTTWLAQRH